MRTPLDSRAAPDTVCLVRSPLLTPSWPACSRLAATASRSPGPPGHARAAVGALTNRGFVSRLAGAWGGREQRAPEVTPTAKERPQQARDGQHDMAVGDGSEKLLPKPFGPEQLLLLLTGGAEATGTAGEGDEHAAAALGAPQPRKAVRE